MSRLAEDKTSLEALMSLYARNIIDMNKQAVPKMVSCNTESFFNAITNDSLFVDRGNGLFHLINTMLAIQETHQVIAK